MKDRLFRKIRAEISAVESRPAPPLPLPEAMRILRSLEGRCGDDYANEQIANIYRSLSRALNGLGSYTLTPECNRCDGCALRQENGYCPELQFTPPDCDCCDSYTPRHEHRYVDPLCL